MESSGAGHLPSASIGRLKLGRRDVAAGRMEPPFIPPVDPARRGQLDVGHRSPAPLAADELGLVQGVHRLGQGVVVGISLGADRVDEREVRELRRANEILKSAAVFFGAELDRRSSR